MPDPLIEKYGLHNHGHSIFAPSSSARWLTCSGSLLAALGGGDSAGIDAAYGTVAHSVAEKWQENQARPTHLVGTTRKVKNGENTFDIPITDEMLAYVEQYVDWCDEVEGDHYYEQRLDLSHLFPIPRQFGTADHVCCTHGTLTITDLKMGTGVVVHVERNPQAMLYALAAFEEWDWIYGFQNIVIRICQPRLDRFEVWTCSREELLEFAEYVKVRARAAWKEHAPRTPSEKACVYCPVKKTCRALASALDDLVDETFEVEDDLPTYEHAQMEKASRPRLPTMPIRMDTEFMAKRLRFRKMYEKWFKAIYEELLARAEKGEEVPGFMLAKGRRSYDWTDPDDAATFLIDNDVPDDEVWKTEIISVSEARKKLRTAHPGLKKAAIEAMLDDLLTVKPGARSLKPKSGEDVDLQDEIDETFDDL